MFLECVVNPNVVTGRSTISLELCKERRYAPHQQQLTTNPVMIALICGLAITGCASKKTPNSAADLGLNGAECGDPGFGPGLHRQCRRPHLLRHRLLGHPRRCAGHPVAPGRVAEPVSELRHRRRRPCRRARHARIQHRARRPPRRRHPRLPDRQGRAGQPPQDHLLRQGTPGRRVRRHLLLVAEPPRGDRR